MLQWSRWKSVVEVPAIVLAASVLALWVVLKNAAAMCTQ